MRTSKILGALTIFAIAIILNLLIFFIFNTAHADETQLQVTADKQENSNDINELCNDSFCASSQDDEANYLTFTAKRMNSTVKLDYLTGEEVEYSTDGINFTTYQKNTIINLHYPDSYVKIRGRNLTTGFDPVGLKYHYFSISGSVEASGSVTSLTDKKGTDPNVRLPEKCYSYMFQDCEGLVRGPDLPSINLGRACYYKMFYGCSSLVQAPNLPNATMPEQCCYEMFDGCSSLVTPPSLPSTDLKAECYKSMFNFCVSLKNIPTLPALTLADSCYSSMFGECSSLTSIPQLPATTLAKSCYHSMFHNCVNLTDAPVLPATKLENSCYDSMFYYCTSLKYAPKLPAMDLENFCYATMFEGCSSLVEPPELPAVTSKTWCYQGMFRNCSSLSRAPELPAKELEEWCYGWMFCGCSKISVMPEMQMEKLAPRCCYGMFSKCNSLTIAKDLNAMQLEEQCYASMFENCESLTTPPKLPSVNLAKSCYYNMFGYCYSLASVPTLSATELCDDCYANMFRDCVKLNNVMELPASELKERCYFCMFTGCSSLTAPVSLCHVTTLAKSCCYGMYEECSEMKIYEEPTLGYDVAWKATSGVDAEDWSKEMFYKTSGTFTGDPVACATYYVKYNPPVMYNIICDDCENGTLSADKLTACKDDTVVLYVNANEGYELGSINVMDAQGLLVELNNLSFKMPACDVMVSAEFFKSLEPNNEFNVTYYNDNIGQTSANTQDNNFIYIISFIIVMAIAGSLIKSNLRKLKWKNRD